MGDLRARLDAALGGRYLFEGEIGHGGMAIVYRAREVKYRRTVAIKVLKPELAGALGPERFLREIAFASSLTHPNILPLHDSGEAAGLLYYVMPLVEGEALRQRIARARQLPLDEAVGIAAEVADALHYAHQHGVLHRDIKPENILLAGSHAIVADFGIARAIVAAGESRVTQAGVAVGTPEYMSPEQAAGETVLDARSDIYSLGCVLHEMLTGQPPFTGHSAQAVLQQQLTARPPALRATRPDVPPRLEDAVTRALAKAAAERFASAGELRDALRGSAPTAARRSPAARVVAAAVGFAAVGVASWLLFGLRHPGDGTLTSDPNLVAVLPFRVTASDSSLAFLREGMLDLLAARLTGEVGPRAVDPRALLANWRRIARGADVDAEAALGVARRLGAGRVLSGGIVASPSGLTLQASLVPVPPSRRAAADASVEGPLDSLPHLVDQLVAQLLAREAGESAQRLAALTSTSLAALRAYLDGQAKYRSGAYEAAVQAFRRALAIDSTFALAGIGLRNAAIWTISSADAASQGLAAAQKFRHRLGARDREFLDAFLGPHYPAPASYREQLGGWEQIVKEVPDRPEAWFELGEVYLHFAPLLDLEATPQRAAIAFGRAVALDSTFLAPLQHLYQIASFQGDTASARRLGALFLASATGGAAILSRWQLALTLGDSAALRRARRALDSLGLDDLVAVTFFAQIASTWGGGLEDAQHAADLLLRRSTTAEERRIALSAQHNLAANGGRPTAALRAAGALGPRVRVLDALYWDGDTLAGMAAARALAAETDRPLAADPAAREARDADLCALGQWQLWHDEIHSAGGTTTRLRSGRTRAPVSAAGLCVTLLETLGAVLQRESDASQRVERLDSLLRQGPVVDDLREANLVLSRVREAQGDWAGAFRAARRYLLIPGGELYFSSYLRQAARMAVRTGRRDEASTAYRHYLLLRSAPEPAVASTVAEARSELGRLLAEGAVPR